MGQTNDNGAIYVVGDRLCGFANANEDVACFDEALDVIGGRLDARRSLLRVFLAQGLQPDQAAQLREALAPQVLLGRVEIIELTAAQQPASRRLTHKHRPENVLILEPQKDGPMRFVSMLRADDRCADMSDHLTGQHVQGMVLVEAARQMLLAVTEKFFLGDRGADDPYVVLQTMDSRFFRFTFPLDVRVVYELLAREDDPRGSATFEAHVGFYQAGRLTTEVGLKYAVFGSSAMKRIEARKAAEALALTRIQPLASRAVPA